MSSSHLLVSNSCKLTLTLALAAVASTGSGGARAQAGGKATAPPASGLFEVNVTNQASRINGQPVVAVNPRNKNNLVYISADHIPNATGTGVQQFLCYTAYSMDGGETWTQVPFPKGAFSSCGDPYLAVDKDGNFFTVFNQLGNTAGGGGRGAAAGRGAATAPTAPAATAVPAAPATPATPGAAGGRAAAAGRGGGGGGSNGGLGVARSPDGGRTWQVLGRTSAGIAATPRLRVDIATGKVYGVGGDAGINPPAVTVSSDHGMTWAPRAALPPQSVGNQIAVYAGLLATATATKVEAGGAVADAARFWVSTDDGKTFTSMPVTDSKGVPARPASGKANPVLSNGGLLSTDPIPWITADTSRRGRFAVMMPTTDALLVYVTDDIGKTWRGPATIPAAGAMKPWIEFGPRGELGVTWRTIDNKLVNAFATVSFNSGRTFGPPLKVNRGDPYPYTLSGTGGDEWSRIMIDGSYAYVTFADARTGGAIDGILARVPLSMFKR